MTRAEQLTFSLSERTAIGRADYFVSSSNSAAVAAIDNWRNWSQGGLLLTGPKAAGKTHLTHVWAAQSRAKVLCSLNLRTKDCDELADGPLALDNLHLAAGEVEHEHAAFHLYNLMLDRGYPLLITGQGGLRSWGLQLADLVSRLQALPTVSLPEPDDQLLAAVLIKQFADRQIALAPPVVPYILSRIERSFEAIQDVVVALDQAALAKKSPITKPLARQVLDKLSPDNA